MAILYIIAGFVCIAFAVYWIDKRDRMKLRIYSLQMKRENIERTNRELDELQSQLDMMEQPLSTLNQICSKILKYMK